ncbi:gastrin-releasing peptide receptor-like [Diadema setosum]|uniref:gastrin-releasing peptide receptor-like n=1 Tax=Diadema setosum TaxID=31175 RepID=UPI003B3AE5BF
MNTSERALLDDNTDLPDFTATEPNYSILWDSVCSSVDHTYLPSAIFVGLLSILGITAHIGLLVITCMNKSLRTPSSLFLISVIWGDLMYLILRAPLIVRKLLGPLCWRGSLLSCKTHLYFEAVTQYVCILSLTALSVERYMAVVRGLESRQINSKHFRMIGAVGTWLLALVLAIPSAVIAHTYTPMRICSNTKLNNPYGLLYDIYGFISMYFIPLLMISVLYISIAVTLYRSSHIMLNNARQDTTNRRQTSQRKRLAIIFVLITVSFAVLWMPHFIYRLWVQTESFLGNDLPHSKSFEEIAAISALLNASLDPYIVFAMSTVYRKSLSKCCQKQSGYCCEKSENHNRNNLNRSSNYHRSSVTIMTSLKASQSAFPPLRRNSPSTTTTDTAL